MTDSSALTPVQWLARLGPKLVDRQDAVRYWRRYFEGDHDLPAGPSQHKEAYLRFQKLARTNLCGLAAESMVHRMATIGFRYGTDLDQTGPNNEIWRLWQAAKLDARQFAIYRKAFSRSAAYVTVGPYPGQPNRPRVTIEGPENVIVETDPADASVRLAALRVWHDPIVKRWMATLYVPGWRYHWRSRKEAQPGLLDTSLRFQDTDWEPIGEPARSLSRVPVVAYRNGDEGEDPRAEFDAGIDVQNRLNLTLLNRLTAERYAAFRQRYLLNYEPDEDEATGLPIAPFKPGTDQVWTVPPPEMGDPAPQIGDFAQTDTSQMLRGVEADMRAFAAVTITPVYYLPGDLINIGADAVAALDAGHTAKIRQRMAQWGEDHEETLSLMAEVARVDVDLTQSEVVWARPENFNLAQVADYASKLVASKIPVPMVAEEIGWTPQRVAQLRSEMAADAMRASLTQFGAGQPVAPTAPTSPEG